MFKIEAIVYFLYFFFNYLSFFQPSSQVLSLPKTNYRNQTFGMFVVDMLDTLIRHGRDTRVEKDKTRPIAEYFTNVLIPALAQLLADAAAKPAFIRGVLQDSGLDWKLDMDSLFDGRSVVDAIKEDNAKAEAIMNAARFLTTISEEKYFQEERRKLLGTASQNRLLTAHPDDRNPHVLLRLAYLLVSVSFDDNSCAWLYQQPNAIAQIAKAMQSLAAYGINDDPHLSRNQSLRDLREPATKRTLGAVLPTLVVFFDNMGEYLAFNNNNTVAEPAQADLSLWIQTIFPAISATLLSTTTTDTSSLVMQFLPNVTAQQRSRAYILEGTNSEVCTVLQALRRRGAVLRDRTLDGNDSVAFKSVANICELAYDHLFNIIQSLSKHCAPLRAAAARQLIAVCDAVLTRVTKTPQEPIGTLELLQERRFASLDWIFKVSEVVCAYVSRYNYV